MSKDSGDFSSVLKEKLLYSIQSLCEIGEELSSIERFDTSSQSVLHLIMGTLMISKAAILLFDKESGQLKLAASRGVSDSKLTIDMPSNVHNKLHHSSDPILVSNPESKVLKEFFDTNADTLKTLHSHYWLSLRVKSRLLGIISVSKKFMNQEYEHVDLELLNIIVQQLSIAINNYYLIRDLKQTNFRLNRKLLELETLYDLGIAIGSIMEVEELAEQILINAVGLTDASAGLIALKSDSGLEMTTSINVPEVDPAELEKHSCTRQVIDEGETFLDNSGDTEDHPFGFRKVLFVPLSGQRETLGLLGLADKESRDGIMNFSEADKRLLQNFATQAAVAIENAKFYRESLEKERLERELQVAASIQRTILPDKPPDIPGLEIAAITIPSRFVGGDHYDFHSRDGSFLFTIADVSGKGIPAALLVSTLHATQHALIQGEEWDPPSIVKRISRSIFRSTLSNKFISFFMARYDLEKSTITAVNAGHNYPLIISPDGRKKYLQKGGLVLGMLPDSPYEWETASLERGDVFVMFTDGVNEAMNEQEEEFGDERFEEILVNNRDRTAGEILNTVMNTIREFSKGAAQHDDITLVVCKKYD
jgi:sigma-B regulation protein RsbU (phosphoserine phosphatase)